VGRGRANARRDFAKLLKTGLLILALVLQGYLGQLHRHASAQAEGGAVLALVANGDSGGLSDGSSAPPLDGDGRDLHCFICHLTGHGAAPLLPHPVVFALAPPRAIAYVAAESSFDPRHAPSGYSSRAPPFRPSLSEP
jgi:hypothetical protein